MLSTLEEATLGMLFTPKVRMFPTLPNLYRTGRGRGNEGRKRSEREGQRKQREPHPDCSASSFSKLLNPLLYLLQARPHPPPWLPTSYHGSGAKRGQSRLRPRGERKQETSNPEQIHCSQLSKFVPFKICIYILHISVLERRHRGGPLWLAGDEMQGVLSLRPKVTPKCPLLSKMIVE